jgi:hypothetical protein
MTEPSTVARFPTPMTVQASPVGRSRAFDADTDAKEKAVNKTTGHFDLMFPPDG